jgi:ABC-type sugar transport system permease subunit
MPARPRDVTGDGRLTERARFLRTELVTPFSGGPGSTTELVSITLKRAAFEKWRTGYSSALAIVLFVTVFGAANIYVKALNRVKQR